MDKKSKEANGTLRAFLLKQYGGHCQICWTRLEVVRDIEPLFDVYLFGEEEGLHGELCNREYNAICLCPNCHALIKQWNSGLEGIIEQAKQIAASNKKGDCYKIRINIVGDQAWLFYTAEHVSKIEEFVNLSEGNPR